MDPFVHGDKQPESENNASQQIDKRLLTFAIIAMFIRTHTLVSQVASDQIFLQRTVQLSVLYVNLPSCRVHRKVRSNDFDRCEGGK